MRKIMIVGAGQSGLQLALGLIAAGYEVSLVTNRTGNDIHAGKVMSSQCMFHTSLQIERDLGLNQWERDCPTVDGISLAVPHPEQKGAKVIDWGARLRSYAQSVDQRVKIPGWMAEFATGAEGRGLQVIIAGAGGAAHLPGMVAAHTILPVLGVPVQSAALQGLDSLLSIVQMPGGVPVATLAIGKAGAINAGLLAAAILATSRPELREQLKAFRAEQTQRVRQETLP